MRSQTTIRYRIIWVSTLGLFVSLITVAARQKDETVQPSLGTLDYQAQPALGEWGTNFQVWKDHSPEQYDRWIQGGFSVESTSCGGVLNSKIEENPRLRVLYAGSPYALDYNKARRHTCSMEDLLRTDRFGKDKLATCMTCKSSAVPSLVAKMGAENFDNSRISDFKEPEVKSSISCINCHEPKSMRLRFYVPAVRDALFNRKVDPEMISDSEMRVYTCAQCHSDYYFQNEAGKVSLKFGWRAGKNFEDLEEYYNQIDYSDWIHPDTGAPLVKVQHPEYELWSWGVHARRGVSCASCHMPVLKTEPERVTDHWIRTPLAHLDKACKPCHENATVEDMEAEILAIQKRTKQLLDRTELALVDAIQSIKEARQAGVQDDELILARDCHRKAHLRWDFVSSESSKGAHSPHESAKLLGEAIDYARTAQLDAIQALQRHKQSKKGLEGLGSPR